MKGARHIDRVGIELEGAFHLDPDYCSHLLELKADSSVDDSLYCGSEDACPCGGCLGEPQDDDEDCTCDTSIGCYVGEAVSRPLSSMDQINAFLEECYPEHSNSSCGMHVHVSVHDPQAYSLLTEEAFFIAFKHELAAIGKRLNVRSRSFWSRLSGANTSYCADAWHPGEQMNGSGDRYTILNFCYRRHGTMEVRVLPMFRQKDIALKVIQNMLAWIECYIDGHIISSKTWGEEDVSIDASTLRPATRRREVMLCV